MLDWYRDLERTGRRTFLACFGGWTLDAFDAQMYSLVIPALLATWHISKTAAGSVAGASLAASALGGWIAGVLADRYGRVRMLQVTIAWFAVFSLGSALTHDIRQLIVVRALQGFGFGGEWTVGTVLLAETVPAALRGRALGSLQSGWAVVWAGAVVCSMVAFLCLPQHLAWRVLFAVGFLPALLLLYIQRSLKNLPDAPPETPGHRLRLSSLMEIFAPKMLRTTLLAALLGLGAHGGYYALTVWLPLWLMQNRHLSVSHMSASLGILIVFFGFGCLTASWLLDLLGRRRTIVIFSFCCAAMVVAYLILPVSNLAMFYLGAPLGFFSAGIPASMGTLFSELFPSGIRGTGVGFCYNFGRVASGGVPMLVGALSTAIPLNLAIGLTAATAYLLVILAVLCLPETHRQVLQT